MPLGCLLARLSHIQRRISDNRAFCPPGSGSVAARHVRLMSSRALCDPPFFGGSIAVSPCWSPDRALRIGQRVERPQHVEVRRHEPGPKEVEHGGPANARGIPPRWSPSLCEQFGELCADDASRRAAIAAMLIAGDSARCAAHTSRANATYCFGDGRAARKPTHQR